MTDGHNGAGKEKAAHPLCVICGQRPQTEQYRPFCSKRCADIDLHRWLGGVYAIPSKAGEEEDEDGTPAAPPDEAGAPDRTRT